MTNPENATAPAWRFDVDAAALRDAVAMVARVIERRNPVPILSNIMIDLASDGGGLTLTATNLDAEISQFVPCHGGGSVPADCRRAVTVDSVVLSGVLKKLPSGAIAEISISFNFFIRIATDG